MNHYSAYLFITEEAMFLRFDVINKKTWGIENLILHDEKVYICGDAYDDVIAVCDKIAKNYCITHYSLNIFKIDISQDTPPTITRNDKDDLEILSIAMEHTTIDTLLLHFELSKSDNYICFNPSNKKNIHLIYLLKCLNSNHIIVEKPYAILYLKNDSKWEKLENGNWSFCLVLNDIPRVSLNEITNRLEINIEPAQTKCVEIDNHLYPAGYFKFMNNVFSSLHAVYRYLNLELNDKTKGITTDLCIKIFKDKCSVLNCCGISMCGEVKDRRNKEKSLLADILEIDFSNNKHTEIKYGVDDDIDPIYRDKILDLKNKLYIFQKTIIYTATYYTMFNSLFDYLKKIHGTDICNVNILSIGCGCKSDALALKYASDYRDNIHIAGYTGIDSKTWSGYQFFYDNNDSFIELTDHDNYLHDECNYINDTLGKVEEKRITGAGEKEIYAVIFPNMLSELEVDEVMKLMDTILNHYKGKELYLLVSLLRSNKARDQMLALKKRIKTTISTRYESDDSPEIGIFVSKEFDDYLRKSGFSNKEKQEDYFSYEKAIVDKRLHKPVAFTKYICYEVFSV